MLKKNGYNTLNKKIFFTFLLALFLTGCGHQTKESYLISHPAKFKTILMQCETMGQELARNDTQCQFAINLYSQLFEFTKEIEQNPESFGKKILATQMQLGDIKKQIDTKYHQKHKFLIHHDKVKSTPKNIQNKVAWYDKLVRLTKQTEQLQSKINVMLALVAQSEGMG